MRYEPKSNINKNYSHYSSISGFRGQRLKTSDLSYNNSLLNSPILICTNLYNNS